jgi:hypothetical protein
MLTHLVVPGVVIGVCIGIAGVMWTVGQKHWPWVILILVLTASAGLMNTQIGAWARLGTGWLSSLLTGFTGRLGVTITLAVLAVTLIVYLAYRLKNRQIDIRTVAAVAGVPIAVGSIPGVVGGALATGLGMVVELVTWGISAAFGLH